MPADRPFTIRAHSVSTAQSYRFVFEKPEAWFIATINDVTGELLITSDYRNYAHRWPVDGFSCTLTQFLAGKGREQWDCDYIVNKLRASTQSKELDDVIDDDATWKGVAEQIVAARRGRDIGPDLARELWAHLEHWRSSDFQWDALDSDLSGFLNDHGGAWECIRHKQSGWYLVLRDELLPFFCRWLRQNVVSKQAEATNVG